jgi:hypothetical protein
VTGDEDASAYRLAAERITRLEREKAEAVALLRMYYDGIGLPERRADFVRRIQECLANNP